MFFVLFMFFVSGTLRAEDPYFPNPFSFQNNFNTYQGSPSGAAYIPYTGGFPTLQVELDFFDVVLGLEMVARATMQKTGNGVSIGDPVAWSPSWSWGKPPSLINDPSIPNWSLTYQPTYIQIIFQEFDFFVSPTL